MTQWGTFEKPAANGQEPDVVTLQADAVNRARYERKGYKYTGPAEHPARVGQSRYFGNPRGAAGVTMLGQPAAEVPEVDDATVVKEAMEVALRKMTGTWTSLEQVAAHNVHPQGKLLPEETDEMLRGNPVAGFEQLKEEGVELINFAAEPRAGVAVPDQIVPPPGGPSARDGSGVAAPRPERE